MDNKKIVGVLVGGIGLGAALGFGAGTKLGKKSATQATNSSSDSATCSVGGQASAPTGIFELDGQVYTKDDLPSDARETHFSILSQSYEGLASFAKEQALRISLAKLDPKYDPKNIPPLKALISAEKPSEPEMKKFYEANKGSLPPGTTFEKIKPQLAQFLEGQKIGEVSRTKMAELETTGKIKILVQAPTAPFVSLKLDAYPFKGSAEAKVTVVKVSDYLCPHCRHAVPEIEEVVEKYKDKIKFVQANFALRPAGLSGALTRGAFCAQQQSSESFWKFHNKAFNIALERAQPKGTDQDKEFQDIALEVAKDATLDVPKFTACYVSNESKKFMDDSIAELSAAGVSGTPTFFVNNRKVTTSDGGVVTSLSRAIDAELAGTAVSAKQN